MKESSKYITLIHKNLTGQIAPEDKAILDEWLAESVENRHIADDLKAIWIASDTYLSSDNPSMAKGLSRLRATIEQEKEQQSIAPAKPSILRYLTRVAAVAALVAGLFFVWQNRSGDDIYNQIVNTANDEQTDMMLEDGTLVFMNESSTLEKALVFDEEMRLVSLSGEAFFEVAKNPEKPFVVSTENFDVEVLGTAFNIFAPKKGELQEVVVEHGKVRVNFPKTDETFILEKGDRLVYNNKTKTAQLSKDAQQNAQSWRTGRLDFKNTPLEDVLFAVEKHFDVTIDCKNESVLNCPFSNEFQDEDIKVVMEVIQTVFGFEMDTKKSGKKYKLSAGSCN